LNRAVGWDVDGAISADVQAGNPDITERLQFIGERVASTGCARGTVPIKEPTFRSVTGGQWKVTGTG